MAALQAEVLDVDYEGLGDAQATEGPQRRSAWSLADGAGLVVQT